MKVLYVVPYAPNLIRVRPYNLIRSLVERGHEVTVATLWSDEGERQEAAALAEQVHAVEAARLPRWRSYLNCVAAIPSQTPLQAVYCWEPGLVNRLDRLIAGRGRDGQFDVVHVEHLRGARYGLWIKQHYPELPVVWDSVDCISLLFEQAAGRSKRAINRLISSFELGRNRKYEGWLPGQFEHTLVTSHLDQQAFIELMPSNGHTPRISVLPNGVDLEYFKPDPSQPRQDKTLVISGKMSYHANVSMVLYFVEQILPLVRVALPDVKLWIVGKDPTAEIQKLADDPGITVSGTVKDMRPYLQQAAVAVSPVLYGAGIQNKVLEAMACGTPVVSTRQAVSALDIQPGQDLCVGNDPGEVAHWCIKLLSDPSFRRQIGLAGMVYVQKKHNWLSIADQLGGIYDEAIQFRN